MFSTNQAQGLNDVAPHPVYPGFHSMPLVEVSMNKDKWDALPDDLQALEESVKEFAADPGRGPEGGRRRRRGRGKASGKITVHDWSDEERAKFRQHRPGRVAEGRRAFGERAEGL